MAPGGVHAGRADAYARRLAAEHAGALPPGELETACRCLAATRALGCTWPPPAARLVARLEAAELAAALGARLTLPPAPPRR